MVRAAIVACTLLLSALAGAAVGARDVWLPIVTAGERSPMGFGMAHGEGQLLSDYAAAETLGAGWYHNWYVMVSPQRPNGIEFVQVVNVSEFGPSQPLVTIVEAAGANPGSTWLLGNEIDVASQNGMEPEAYAPVYHALYHSIRGADATALIAPGSVSQWTPSRQRYMERVLLEYRRLYGEALPADVWNVHAYALPEDVVGLPVGVQAPMVWVGEAWRQTDVGTFAGQVTALRQWLEVYGYGHLPLIVSEFGVLWGATETEVSTYLREATVWLEGSGAVSQWAWFSLNDDSYPGVLVDAGGLTVTGRAFAETGG